MNVRKNRTPRLLTYLLSFGMALLTTYGFAADRYVSITGNNANNGSAAAPWRDINYAVANSQVGDVINLGAGTWTEQVVIAKNLTLQGAGVNQTKIESPASLNLSFVFNRVVNGNTITISYYAVVYANNASNVVLKNLTVDGKDVGNANNALTGVLYNNASGLVDGVKIIQTRTVPPYTSEFGFGLIAYANDGVARQLTFSNSEVITFQKNATAFFGANLTATVEGNTITGAGPLANLAQNGIQFSIGATGVIRNNVVRNIVYNGGDRTASAILVLDPRSSVAISGNKVYNSQTGIFVIGGDASISQNTVFVDTLQMGESPYWWGVLGRRGNFKVFNNDIDLGGYGSGIDGFSIAGETTNLEAKNNLVKNTTTGIAVEDDGPGGKSYGKVNCNSITNALELLYNNQKTIVMDGECNWLGFPDSASFAQFIYNPDNNVDYTPWLKDGVDARPDLPGFQPRSGSNGCACSDFKGEIKAVQNVKCYDGDNGSVSVAVSGGTAPYTYRFDSIPSATAFTGNTFTINELEAGTYRLVIADAMGYSQTLEFTITQPTVALDAQATVNQNVKCFGSANGSVTISAVGGTAPYTGTGTFNNLPAGDTTFTITDASGCSDAVVVTILQPTKLDAEATTPKSSCNGNTGSVTVSASGGTAPYSGTGEKTNLAPGRYVFYVTDAAGCKDSVVVNIDGSGVNGGFNAGVETFPNKFNTNFNRSLNNATFAGSTGTWTASSNSYGTIVVTTPYYQPSTSHAIKITNFKTQGCGAGFARATSPKLNITGPCCPAELKLSFTLWTYNVVCNDNKAALEIDFSSDGGATWTEVASATSGQLFSAYRANAKTTINIPVPVAFQTSNFRYRFRGEMQADDCNNFYVFIDDINITSPAVCTPLGSIGNYVWKDLNADGKQSSNEAGIANVSVKLTLPNGTSRTTTTSSTGYYLFTELPAGTYTVSFTTPSGLIPTSSNQGSDDAIDSDPVNGSVTVNLGVGQNNLTIDAGYRHPVCTNTTNHLETFPNKFNTSFYTSLYNKTFTGSTGTWTINSDARSTMAVTTPYYSPSSSYALKVVQYKTDNCGSSSSKAVSPKVDISNPCCPSELKMYFTLWTYKVVCNDWKAKLAIDFSNNNGSTWTQVASATSAELYHYYGANGKVNICIPVPSSFQTANFRYRIRGEMAAGDCNNFYVFIDDIKIGSPANCSSGSRVASDMVTKGGVEADKETTATISAFDETAKKAVPKIIDGPGEWSLNVFPNPTNNEFELRLSSTENAAASIRVTDALGRVVKTMRLAATQSVRFGSDLKPGNYIVEVTQGDKTQSLKLLKL